MMSLETTPGPETGAAPPPSVLLRYASLVVVVVMALAGVIARESWVAYRGATTASSGAPLRSALVMVALPPALTAWLAVHARVVGLRPGRPAPAPGR